MLSQLPNQETASASCDDQDNFEKTIEDGAEREEEGEEGDEGEEGEERDEEEEGEVDGERAERREGGEKGDRLIPPTRNMREMFDTEEAWGEAVKKGRKELYDQQWPRDATEYWKGFQILWRRVSLSFSLSIASLSLSLTSSRFLSLSFSFSLSPSPSDIFCQTHVCNRSMSVMSIRLSWMA